MMVRLLRVLPAVILLSILFFLWAILQVILEPDRAVGSGASDSRSGAAIYDSPEVVLAPPAMLHRSGEKFADARGEYVQLVFNEEAKENVAPYVNVIFTRAGHLRSGDVHRCTQLNSVVFGAVELTTRSHDGNDKTQHYGQGEAIRIPPHTPHLYRFIQDTVLTEAWTQPDGSPCSFEAWLYKPFRDRISSASLERTHDAP